MNLPAIPLQMPVRANSVPKRRPLSKPRRSRPLLGELLVDAGHLSEPDLLVALALHTRQQIPLGEILTARGTVDPSHVLDALALQHGLERVDLDRDPPDPQVLSLLAPTDCLAFGVVPWRQRKGGLVLATSHPERMAELRRKLPPGLEDAAFVLAMPNSVTDCIQKHMGDRLATRAEARTEARDSCRRWSISWASLIATIFATAFTLLAIFALPQVLTALFAAACLALLANTALKAVCAGYALFRQTRAPSRSTEGPQPALRLPKMSVLVPLFHERNIISALMVRLSRLSYPRELLEVCLIVEASDTVTKNALKAASLPPWMQIVVVPPGEIQTKPRALNYALDFTSGDIVGVYDAEDAPEPDQLHKVARRFAEGGAQLACLQGALSFYNWRTNWLSRCFFFEYAGWFRVMLPGLQRLGFAIPLGGTTLFFRRDILVKIGAWDAHNVTEDADLGMRLARRGYRCEMLDTTTHEEANSRVWPWIKQRSRWLKGYAVTWCVHMRRPVQLWRELGAWRFFGFQLLFLATLASFFLAPVLWWTLLALPLGLPNPVFDHMPPGLPGLLMAFFILAEVATLTVFAVAVRRSEQRSRPRLGWILTLPAYFLFGTLAAYKGLAELLFAPFYWDKTEHGQFGGAIDGGLVSADSSGVDLEPGLKCDRQMFSQRLRRSPPVPSLDGLHNGQMLGQGDLAPALRSQ